MELLIVLLAVAILGAAAVASAGGLGHMPAQPVRDVYQPVLPERRLRPEDVAHVRFGKTGRGYNVGQVDSFLARIRDELSADTPTLHAEDLELIRFDMGVGGYQMTQVDEFMDRIQREITPLPARKPGTKSVAEDDERPEPVRDTGREGI